MNIATNNYQPNFKAKLNVNNTKLNAEEYRRLSQFAATIGSSNDEISIHNEHFIETNVQNCFKLDIIDLSNSDSNKKVQTIKEKINSMIGKSGNNEENVVEKENKATNDKIEDEYQKIQKKSKIILNDIEQLNIPSRIKIYDNEKEPDMLINNLTKNSFEASIGDTTYFYKVIGDEIDIDSIYYELYENDNIMKPSSISKNTKLDKVQVGEHTLQTNYKGKEISSLELETKNVKSLNNENLRVQYKFYDESNKNEYKDFYKVARAVSGRVKSLNDAELVFNSKGNSYIQTTHPVTGGNIIITSEKKDRFKEKTICLNFLSEDYLKKASAFPNIKFTGNFSFKNYQVLNLTPSQIQFKKGGTILTYKVVDGEFDKSKVEELQEASDLRIEAIDDSSVRVFLESPDNNCEGEKIPLTPNAKIQLDKVHSNNCLAKAVYKDNRLDHFEVKKGNEKTYYNVPLGYKGLNDEEISPTKSIEKFDSENNVEILYKNGVAYMVKISDSNTGEVRGQSIYYKEPYKSMIECLKEKVGNKEFVTDVYEKNNDISAYFKYPQYSMYKEYCQNERILNKLVSYQNRTLKDNCEINDDKSNPYIKFYDIDEKVYGSYINDSQIKFSPKCARWDDNESFIYDTKDKSITAIRNDGDSVQKVKLCQDKEGFYRNYITSSDLESQDCYQFQCFYDDEYSDGQLIAGKIFKDGDNIIAMSITKSVLEQGENPDVQFSITKYPNSEHIIISSKYFDEDLMLKAENIQDLNDMLDYKSHNLKKGIADDKEYLKTILETGLKKQVYIRKELEYKDYYDRARENFSRICGLQSENLYQAYLINFGNKE